MSECPAPAYPSPDLAPVTLAPWSSFLWILLTSKLPASMLLPPRSARTHWTQAAHTGCQVATLSGPETWCPLERTVTQSQGVCVFPGMSSGGSGALTWVGR